MEAKGEPRPSSEEKGDADAEPSLAAKLTRFVEKNPLFKSAIRRFMEEHCARFTGDEGDEHKLEWTQLHDEFVQVTAPPTPTQSTLRARCPALQAFARALSAARARHTHASTTPPRVRSSRMRSRCS